MLESINVIQNHKCHFCAKTSITELRRHVEMYMKERKIINVILVIKDFREKVTLDCIMSKFI